MGLDSYWEASEEDGELEELTDNPNLTGGIFSGSGLRSFRGKVYNVFIKWATDGEYSLYEDLNQDQVTDIASILEELSWEDVGPDGVDPEDVAKAPRREQPVNFHGGYHGFRDEQELEGFVSMFSHYAEQDAMLLASY